MLWALSLNLLLKEIPGIRSALSIIRKTEMFNSVQELAEANMKENLGRLLSFCIHAESPPHNVTNVSPAELLHGRPLNTTFHISCLQPTGPPKQQTNLKESERKQNPA